MQKTFGVNINIATQSVHYDIIGRKIYFLLWFQWNLVNIISICFLADKSVQICYSTVCRNQSQGHDWLTKVKTGRFIQSLECYGINLTKHDSYVWASFFVPYAVTQITCRDYLFSCFQVDQCSSIPLFIDLWIIRSLPTEWSIVLVVYSANLDKSTHTRNKQYGGYHYYYSEGYSCS